MKRSIPICAAIFACMGPSHGFAQSKVNLQSQVQGTLQVSSGGTGSTSATGSGAVVLASGPTLANPTLTTPNLGTPSAVTLTHASGLPLATGVSGTLSTANGGTGNTSGTATDPTAQSLAIRALKRNVPTMARTAQQMIAKAPTACAGSTTYAGSTYTAVLCGTQPTALKAGMQVTVNFSTANTGSASLAFGSLTAQTIKRLASNGTVLNLTGGEIVGGPQSLTYDGTEWILGNPGSRVVTVSGATSITQADWANRSTFLLTSAATLTLPCSSTLGANGGVNVAAMGVTATIAVTSGCTPTDYITKNAALGTSTSQTLATNGFVLTNGSGGFDVSGS